jgi:hypothetical protein
LQEESAWKASAISGTKDKIMADEAQGKLAALRIAGSVIGDPRAGLKLVTGGREGLHRYAVRRLLGVDAATVEASYSQIEGNSRFNAHVKAVAAAAGRPLGGFVRPADLYVICRIRKPDVVVETGVASGLSSAHILQALDDNSSGKLYSIDLPNADTEELLGKVITRLPEGRTSGWVVPDWLRGRWDLRIGKSGDLLPPLLEELTRVSIFLHDSEHSFDNMTFEFNQAWPRLVKGGYLIADDVNLPASRGAFYSFAKREGRTPARVYAGFGVVMK